MNKKIFDRDLILLDDAETMLIFMDRLKKKYKNMVILTFDVFRDCITHSNFDEIYEKIRLLIVNADTKSKYQFLYTRFNDFFKKNEKFLVDQKDNYHELQLLLRIKKDKDIIDTLKHLVFEVKNPLYVLEILKLDMDFALCVDEDGHRLLDMIIDEYIKLSSHDHDEVIYYYIILSNIIDNLEEFNIYRESILERLRDVKVNNSHIRMLIDKINNPENDRSELEYKYNLSYIYPNINIWDSYNKNPRFVKDYSRELVYTIDGESDTCLDDAIQIKQNNNGTYSLLIHISDTSAIIRKDSLLDLEARRRVETIYLPDSSIEMLPRNVSSDDLSLLPNKLVNVITYEFLVDKLFCVVPDSLEIYRSIISPKYKLSYVGVDSLLNGKKSSDDNELMNSLYIAAMVSENLRNNNQSALKYRELENEIDKIFGVKLKQSYYSASPSSRIVSEFATLVGRTMADCAYSMSIPFIYRVNSFGNDGSSLKDLKTLTDVLVENKINTNSESLARILEVIKRISYRSYYSNQALSHNGLKYEHYSHVTSPLRRYADMYNEYTIDLFLFKGRRISDSTYYNLEEEIKRLCPYLNKRVDDNLSFSMEYCKMLSMSKKRKK